MKWACLALSLGSLLLAAGMLGWRKTGVKTVEPERPSEVLGLVNRPLIVERSGDKLLWRLEAARAEQEQAGRMHLIRPRLELYGESGEAIPIRAREAWFEPLAKRIRFHGEVEVRYQDWVVRGETLAYDQGKDEVRMPRKFRVIGPGVRARGRNLRIRRSAQRLWVEEGIWIEDARPGAWGARP